jgi:hypothetical protein
MLVYQLSRREKWLVLLFTVAGLTLSIGMVAVNTPTLFRTDVSGGVLLDAGWNFIAGLCCTPLALSFLYWGWCRGRIHTRVIANSRTLALVPAGRRAIFLKRSDCIGTTHHGAIFLLRDGTTRRTDFPMTLIGREQEEFIPHLYRLWWPDRKYTRGGPC